jgi:hypothetical protein
MKQILIFSAILLMTIQCKAQNAPKPSDPCQKLDTNNIKELILGTWVDMSDSNHSLIINEDTLTENILIVEGGTKKVHTSYWSYTFTDNIFSSDAVTCYSIREFKEGYSHHEDVAINSLDAHYMLLGAEGKTIYKRKN